LPLQGQIKITSKWEGNRTAKKDGKRVIGANNSSVGQLVSARTGQGRRNHSVQRNAGFFQTPAPSSVTDVRRPPVVRSNSLDGSEGSSISSALTTVSMDSRGGWTTERMRSSMKARKNPVKLKKISTNPATFHGEALVRTRRIPRTRKPIPVSTHQHLEGEEIALTDYLDYSMDLPPTATTTTTATMSTPQRTRRRNPLLPRAHNTILGLLDPKQSNPASVSPVDTFSKSPFQMFHGSKTIISPPKALESSQIADRSRQAGMLLDLNPSSLSDWLQTPQPRGIHTANLSTHQAMSNSVRYQLDEALANMQMRRPRTESNAMSVSERVKRYRQDAENDPITAQALRATEEVDEPNDSDIASVESDSAVQAEINSDDEDESPFLFSVVEKESFSDDFSDNESQN